MYLSVEYLPKARKKKEKKMRNSKRNDPSNINVPVLLEKIKVALRYFEKGS